MELRLPVRHVYETQPFGVNFVDFYKQMGLTGHPGIDFRSFNGFSCYAAQSGTVTRSGKFSDGGIGIEIDHGGYLTFYYHLKETKVNIGDKVYAGQEIGFCDNTGKYTTNDHLHFELRVGGQKIDPAPYFTMAYNGFKLEDKYKASNAMQRYYRTDKRNLTIEIKVAAALTKYLKRFPDNEQIKMCVYGGWGREDVENPAMRTISAYITKADFLSGKKPFQN